MSSTIHHHRCDCLDHCGDDPRVGRGLVDPCPRMLAWRARPRIVEVRRHSEFPHALVVHYDRPPTDDDAAYLRSRERWPSP